MLIDLMNPLSLPIGQTLQGYSNVLPLLKFYLLVEVIVRGHHKLHFVSRPYGSPKSKPLSREWFFRCRQMVIALHAIRQLAATEIDFSSSSIRSENDHDRIGALALGRKRSAFLARRDDRDLHGVVGTREPSFDACPRRGGVGRYPLIPYRVHLRESTDVGKPNRCGY